MLGTHTKQPGHWYLAKQCSRNFAACCGLTLPDTVIQKFRSELSNVRLDLALEMRFVQLRWLQHDSPTGSLLCLYSACCTGQVAHQVVSIGIPKKSEASCQFCVVWNIALEKGLHGMSRLCRLWRLSCLVVVLSKTECLCVFKSPGLSEGHQGWGNLKIARVKSIIWRGHHRWCKEVSSGTFMKIDHCGKCTSWDDDFPKRDLATWLINIFRSTTPTGPADMQLEIGTTHSCLLWSAPLGAEWHRHAGSFPLLTLPRHKQDTSEDWKGCYISDLYFYIW